jgi:hypothetical protein
MKTLMKELFPTNIRASTNSVTVVVGQAAVLYVVFSISALETPPPDSSEKNSTKVPTHQ